MICGTGEALPKKTNPVFDRKEVRLFSDLLLHMSARGDGIEQGVGRADEIRFFMMGAPPREIRRFGVARERRRKVTGRYEVSSDAERLVLLRFLKSL